MSTKSSIGVERSDGIEAVYCQNDGYLSGVGALLAEVHNTCAAATGIIALGDLQSLKPHLSPPAGVRHYVDRHAPDVTVCYRREYGRSLDETCARNFATEAIWRERERVDFYYLWRGELNGRWFVYRRDDWHDLKRAIWSEVEEKREVQRQLYEALGAEFLSDLRQKGTS